MSDVMTSQTGGSDGFWSVISRGVSEGISRVGANLVPRWAEQQVLRQSNDQLNSTTANNASEGRINDGQMSTSQNASNNVKLAGVTLNTTVLYVGLGVLALIAMIAIFRR